MILLLYNTVSCKGVFNWVLNLSVVVFSERFKGVDAIVFFIRFFFVFLSNKSNLYANSIILTVFFISYSLEFSTLENFISSQKLFRFCFAYSKKAIQIKHNHH